MAVRFDSATDPYSRTLTGMSAWSVVLWIYMTTDHGAAGPFSFGGTEAGGKTVFLSGGTTLKCFDLAANGGGFGALAISTGTWYRVAITVNGANCSYYYGSETGALTVSSVTNIDNAASGAQTLWLGNPSFASEYWDGRVAAVKFFGAALTQTEVEHELAQYQPIRTANLTQHHPFVNAELADYSGNGNTLTAGSTATTTEPGPPIRWDGRLRGQLIVPAAAGGGVAQGGAGALGLGGSARAAKVAVSRGASALGLTGQATARKVAAVTGSCSFALAGAGAARKVAPQAGVSAVGLSGLQSGAPVRAVAGSCSLGLTGVGAARKVAPAAGQSALGLAGAHTVAAVGNFVCQELSGALAIDGHAGTAFLQSHGGTAALDAHAGTGVLESLSGTAAICGR